jgi:hypothetical protein
MTAGCRVDRVALPVAETELQACLRRYKNDSLIAWHLGMDIEDVRAARASYKPPRRIGTYAGGRGNSNEPRIRTAQGGGGAIQRRVPCRYWPVAVTAVLRQKKGDGSANLRPHI